MWGRRGSRGKGYDIGLASFYFGQANTVNSAFHFFMLMTFIGGQISPHQRNRGNKDII